MKNQKVTVLGTDHPTKNEIFTQALESENIVLGTSVGTTSKPNEDCVGASVCGTEIVLAIADGHWGKEASEIAVTKAVELLGPDVRPSTGSETRARLIALYEQINNTLYEMAATAPDAPTSETSLIVCHVKDSETGRYLYWSNFGDSYLFLLRDGRLKLLNTLQPRWLGYISKLSENPETQATLPQFLANSARYVGATSGLEIGIKKLAAGDTLFLCTDGLIGSDKQPDRQVVNMITEALLSDSALEAKVKRIIASALARGEKDNVSCVAAQVD
ncbi:MAG: protein phosphatase 2C domain-containing protein [Chloroflexi bacterium]|nr:protein phosphatase 2C domain-containing protein [Chloroflexota bacterium]